MEVACTEEEAMVRGEQVTSVPWAVGMLAMSQARVAAVTDSAAPAQVTAAVEGLVGGAPAAREVGVVLAHTRS